MKTAYEYSPKMEIVENKGNVDVYLFIPGVVKENITIEATDENTINIEAKRDDNELGKLIHGDNRTKAVNFTKALKLSSRLDKDSVKPKYELGVLHLNIQTKEKEPPKQIEF